VEFSGATDGFRLAYDRFGQGSPVLLLHGWPGERGDWRSVVPRLGGLDVIVPDLRGFGASDRHLADPAAAYSAAAQARSASSGTSPSTSSSWPGSSSMAGRTPSAHTSRASGRTGRDRRSSSATRNSAASPGCIPSRERSSRLSPGTGPARARSPARSLSRRRHLAAGSTCLPRSCGQSTTRYSRSGGQTGSASSSISCACGCCRRRDTSPRWKPPASSPRKSGRRPGSGCTEER
jgi:hypothetical protein